MYDGCFGLSRRPFGSVPQADQYFPAATIEGAKTTLARCIQRGEGAGLVVGPAGTGKTLLCLLLAEQFRRCFQVAMLASGGLTNRRSLYQAILYELGRSYRGMDEGELRLAVVDYVTAGDGSSRGMILLVDEAHLMPLRLLEEIRLLSNVARSGQPLVRLVLAGAPSLEERLANPKLDSLNQRLSARCYLDAFTRTETQDYIQSQINWAGGRGDVVFPEATCQTVFQATGGIVRLINQVCDHALLLSYVAGRKTVEPAGAEEAWADLQQLPTPTTSQSAESPSNGSVIEFGSLDDTGSEPTKPTAAFRVAQVEDEDNATETGEPVAQIHRIEQLLAESEDDFEPAGTIGPEVELNFEEEAVHPFRETFQEEEVVAERYASPTGARLWCDCPVSNNVSETSARETPWSDVDQSASSCWEAPTENLRSDAGWNDGPWDDRGTTPQPEATSNEAGWEWPQTAAPAPQATAPATPVWQNTASTLSTWQESVSASTQPVEPDVALESPQSPSTPPNQYRQLFARLRRG
ncbi:MAG: AAA family ATPase [Planctomycetaceae bacterium]|nr:AAA family ATPase [Planctomycetaceae bacterium]